MLRKIWDIFKYFVLIGLVLGLVNALYLHELRHVRDAVILVTFWITMIIREKSSERNKFISVVYYTTSLMIIASTFLEVFFGISI